MASTRAIARALRSYTNVGMTALEELADFNDVIDERATHEHPKAQPKAARKPVSKTPAKAPAAEPKAVAPPVAKKTQEEVPARPDPSKADAGPRMSEAQKRAIYNLSRRRGISVEQLGQMTLDAYGCQLENLTAAMRHPLSGNSSRRHNLIISVILQKGGRRILTRPGSMPIAFPF
jgi:hypothetical protein